MTGQGPANPALPSNPLADALYGIFRRIQSTFFNSSPTASPRQTPGQSSAGVVTGEVGEYDPDGDPLAISLKANPTRGAVILNADGSYTYTPSQALATSGGTDTFTVTIKETNAAGHIHGIAGFINRLLGKNDGSTITKDVTVTISPVGSANQPPAVGVPAYVIDTVNPTTGVVTGRVSVTDEDQDPLTYAVGSHPDTGLGVVTIDTTGKFTYTPTLQALLAAWRDQTGGPTASFTIVASDGDASISVPVDVPIGVSTGSLVTMLERYGSSPSAVATGADGTVYVANAGANTVSVINPINGSITATVRVGRTPQALGVGTDGRVWIVNSGDNTVTVTDRFGSNLQTVTVGKAPSAITFGEGGTVYVANTGDNTVTVINSSNYQLIRVIGVGNAPTGIATGPDGRIYTANYGDESITSIDPTDGYATETIVLDGIKPFGIAIAPDGTLGLTDPTNNQVVLLTPLPGQAALDATADSTITAGSAIYALRTLAAGISPTHIVADLAGKFLVSERGSNTVSSFDPAANYEATSIAVGVGPSGIAVCANGSIYISSAGDSTVTAINPQSAATFSIPVGVYPRTVTVRPNGDLLIQDNTDSTSMLLSKQPGVQPNYDHTTWSPKLGHYSSLAVGPGGVVYISSYNGRYVGAYSPTGEFLGAAQSGYSTGLGNIAVDPDGRIFGVADGRLWVGSITLGSSIVTEFNEVPNSWATTTVEVNSDGVLYAVREDGVVRIFDSATLTVTGVATLPAAGRYNEYTAVLGPDGSLYLLSGHRGDGLGASLVVVSADASVKSSALTSASDGSAVTVSGELIVGADGRVYVPSVDGRSLVVLSGEDYSTAERIDFGFTGGINAPVLGPDGHIFVNSSRGLIVINPENGYALSAAVNLSAPGVNGIEAGNLQTIVGTGDAVYAIANSRSLDAWPGFRMQLINRITDHQSATAQTSFAPHTLTELWNTLLDRAQDREAGPQNPADGMYIQTARGEDGKSRMIVYLGGTTGDIFDGNQATAENYPAVAGGIKSDQVRAIKQALDACAANSACGSIAEIMLVGYSQGGVDAQNLAAPNLLNPLNVVLLLDLELLGTLAALPSLVSTVITFGSPITTSPSHGDAVLHVHDELDAVPRAVLPLDLAFLRPPGTFLWLHTQARILHHTLYTGMSGRFNLADIVFGTHGDPWTYRTLSHRFTNSTAGEFANVKDALDRFAGGLMAQTPLPEY